MKKRLTMTLDGTSINLVMHYLANYQAALDRKINALLEMMTAQGAEVCRTYLTHIDTGETLNSIMGYRSGDIGVIVAGGHAVWIEFGTGIMRNAVDPYAGRRPEEITEIGAYGEGHGSDLNGWYYYDDKLGKVMHTYGITANAFMLQTANWLRENWATMAKDIFK